MSSPMRPPYQIFAGDRMNIFPGVALMFLLAFIKDSKMFPAVAQWQLNCYTTWNWLLIGLGHLLTQRQWDPFLCVNSFGILVGFRTGFSQGLTENLRKKLKAQGMDVTKTQFLVGDHFLHSLPPMYFLWRLVGTRRRIPHLTVMYGAILSTWFAFRQQAKLDSSSVYVPHPWRRTWVGILCGMVCAPELVNSLIDRRRFRAVLVVMAMMIPYLTTKFDPNLRRKYMFEYAVQCVGTPEDIELEKRRRVAEWAPAREGIKRVQSELCSMWRSVARPLES